MTRNSATKRIVIDTNLFVSGTILKHGLPYELLEAWRGGAVALLTSESQIEELQDVLFRPKFHARVSRYSILRLFVRIQRDATFIPPGPILIPVRDPKDEHVLATAMAGQADFLVTGDADLLVLDRDSRLGRLRIVTVRAFLNLLTSRDGADVESGHDRGPGETA